MEPPRSNDEVIVMPSVTEDQVGCCRKYEFLWNLVKVIGVGSLACAGAILASQTTPLSGWAWAPVIIGAVMGGTANGVSSFAWKNNALQEQLDDQNRELAELKKKVSLLFEANLPQADPTSRLGGK